MRGEIPWQKPDWPGAVPWLEIDTDSLGLVVVDVQLSCAHPDHTPGRAHKDEQPELFEAWTRRIEDLLIPNTQRLLAWFRANGRPIIYTRVGSLLPDAQDQHPKRRLAWLRPGPDAPPYRSPVGSADYAIRPEIAPQLGELVIDKNATGAFGSSPIDFHLQAFGLRTLVICGVSTFACVDNTARDAADRGYNVVLVEDACAGSAGGEAAHDATLYTFGKYFGAIKSTAELLVDLDALVRPQAMVGSAGGD
jgi:nicotinamidase-related amidase